MFIPLLLVNLAASPSMGHADLAKAEKDLSALRYVAAEKDLNRARAARGNDLETNRKILQLTGIVEAALGKHDKATEAFESLLLLAPDTHISDDYGPKISTSFFEAKGWLDDHHPLRFTAGEPQTAPGKVTSLAVSVDADPLLHARHVRFHVGEKRLEAAVSKSVRVEISGGAEVSYWVELLGENDEVLAQLGSPDAPLVAHAPPAPAPVAEAPTPPPTPAPSAPAPAPAPAVAATPAPAGGLVARPAPEVAHPYRPLAYGLAAGGGAALVAGVVFGVMSHSARSQVDGLQTDSRGVVVGMSQTEAASLNSKAKTDGLIADVLFGAGAVAAGAGVGVWIYGSYVTAAPAGEGVAVSGNF